MDDAVLHEPSYRRPEWNESQGEWLTLGDGQAWLIAKPILSLRPIVTGGKMVGRKCHSDLGPDFNAIRKTVSEAIESDDGAAYEDGSFALAILMLGKHYDLPDDAYGELFDTAKLEDDFLLQVWRVASGQAPKQLPAGES